ncbi:MAG: DNA-processing protein DprA, partial [Candidatus Peribacteraceae bacterium]
MTRENTLVWSWLGVLTKKRYDVLQDVYGNLDEALGHMSEELLKSLGCREETVWKTLNRLEEFDPSAYDQELKKRDLHLLSIEDASYPEALRTLPDPPVFLMYRGDLTILSQPCIALVGTRNMSSYGKRVVEEFVPAFVSAGMVTVSGLALGIDTYVAQQTIALSGRTVAVLGHGMAQIFPRSNARLAEQIVENGGLLLSEFPLDSAPDKYTFPARNRIIAGLSLGTVVLEAGEGSGAL